MRDRRDRRDLRQAIDLVDAARRRWEQSNRDVNEASAAVGAALWRLRTADHLLKEQRRERDTAREAYDRLRVELFRAFPRAASRYPVPCRRRRRRRRRR
jgi:hypothetical protein